MIYLTRQKSKGSPSEFQLYFGGSIQKDGTYEAGTPLGKSFTAKMWPLGTRFLRAAASGCTIPVAEAEAAILAIAIVVTDMLRLKQSVRQL